jgi:hypothetical protein
MKEFCQQTPKCAVRKQSTRRDFDRLMLSWISKHIVDSARDLYTMPYPSLHVEGRISRSRSMRSAGLRGVGWRGASGGLPRLGIFKQNDARLASTTYAMSFGLGRHFVGILAFGVYRK